MTQSGHRRHSRNGTLWNVRALPASLRLDAGELDHLGPFLGFLSDQPAEVSGRTSKHRATEVSEPRFRIGVGEASADRTLKAPPPVKCNGPRRKKGPSRAGLLSLAADEVRLALC